MTLTFLSLVDQQFQAQDECKELTGLQTQNVKGPSLVLTDYFPAQLFIFNDFHLNHVTLFKACRSGPKIAAHFVPTAVFARALVRFDSSQITWHSGTSH